MRVGVHTDPVAAGQAGERDSVAGRPLIGVRHVNRMHDEAAPD